MSGKDTAMKAKTLSLSHATSHFTPPAAAPSTAPTWQALVPLAAARAPTATTSSSSIVGLQPLPRRPQLLWLLFKHPLAVVHCVQERVCGAGRQAQRLAPLQQ